MFKILASGFSRVPTRTMSGCCCALSHRASKVQVLEKLISRGCRTIRFIIDASRNKKIHFLQSLLAGITEGIHLAVLAGDFVLSRATLALASLKNAEAVSLMATAVADLVAGETMQMKAANDKQYSMGSYMRETYKKSASLISNSCKAMAMLPGQTEHVAALPFEYGMNLGLAGQLIYDVLDFTGKPDTLGKPSLSDTRNGRLDPSLLYPFIRIPLQRTQPFLRRPIITAPMLFAMEEFPQLQDIIDQGLKNPANLDNRALEYLWRTTELAARHSHLAMTSANSLPETSCEDSIKARQTLLRLTQMTLTRKK